MLRSLLPTVALASLAVLGTLGAASAADPYDDYDGYDYGRYYGGPREPDVTIITRRVEIYRGAPAARRGYGYPPAYYAPPVAYAPPVYGWVYERPLNCGTYHYWDGDRCLDARWYPPVP
ncbi:MAG TPA: hypothetical protein VJ045_10940 [Hyphomicrobiaceae bacterium]|nr:hypothetical protein [Hyphomicrobiaceae bacterium]